VAVFYGAFAHIATQQTVSARKETWSGELSMSELDGSLVSTWENLLML
jgi:hypothetical protein